MTVKLWFITMRDCSDCDEVKKQVESSSVRRYLKETYGVDEFEEKFLDDDLLAMSFVYKYNDWNLPYLVKVELDGAKIKACKLADDYSIEGCIELSADADEEGSE